MQPTAIPGSRAEVIGGERCFQSALDSVADARHIFRGNIKPTANTSMFIPISFTLPHVFKGTNTPLCITSSGNATIDGVVHYYESE